MRVVHVITRMIVGGAQENTLYNAVDLVERHGDEVVLISGPTEGPEGTLLDEARRRLPDVRIVPTLGRAISALDDWRATRELRRLFAELKPDVVHTHSSKAGVVGRLAAMQARVPAVVHTIHGLAFDEYQPWWRNLVYVMAERKAARACHKIISVADAMTAAAIAARVAPPSKFVTIYSGMEVEPFLAVHDSASVRRELGISADALVVGKVARLFEYKGHDDVIDAAKEIVVDHPRAHFLFVGGGAWHERLRAKTASYGIADRFTFTGLVPPERIPELIAAMDVVVHASYREGLARVLPQALISKKPVVSYDIGGAREVVLEGRTGFLLKPGDVAGLARATSRLLANADERERFGACGRELFTEQFRHETMTRRIRDVYCEILGRRGGESGK